MRDVRQLLRRTPAWLAALGGYVLVSFFYLAIPVISHPGRDLIGYGHDPDQFVWMLAWWPHAILDGANPFVTHAVWWPQGTNLAWDTSIPGLALLAAPVTLLGGPVLAYNAARRPPAGARSLDRVSVVPSPDPFVVAVRRGRIPVRLLAVRARDRRRAIRT